MLQYQVWIIDYDVHSATLLYWQSRHDSYHLPAGIYLFHLFNLRASKCRLGLVDQSLSFLQLIIFESFLGKQTNIHASKLTEKPRKNNWVMFQDYISQEIETLSGCQKIIQEIMYPKPCKHTYLWYIVLILTTIIAFCYNLICRKWFLLTLPLANRTERKHLPKIQQFNYSAHFLIRTDFRAGYLQSSL